MLVCQTIMRNGVVTELLGLVKTRYTTMSSLLTLAHSRKVQNKKNKRKKNTKYNVSIHSPILNFGPLIRLGLSATFTHSSPLKLSHSNLSPQPDTKSKTTMFTNFCLRAKTPSASVFHFPWISLNSGVNFRTLMKALFLNKSTSHQ